MGKTKRKSAELTPEEIERQKVDTLPDREVMSMVSVAPEPPVPVEDGDPLFPIDPTPKELLDQPVPKY